MLVNDDIDIGKVEYLSIYIYIFQHMIIDNNYYDMQNIIH